MKSTGAQSAEDRIPTCAFHSPLTWIEHIDLRRRIVHIPRPKSGADKAFDIPLSRAMVRCILRTMRLGRCLYPDQAAVWLVPADSAPGHIIEHKEDRKVLSKWGNDLRQSYRTLAQVAGVSELDVHLLMNHSLTHLASETRRLLDNLALSRTRSGPARTLGAV